MNKVILSSCETEPMLPKDADESVTSQTPAEGHCCSRKGRWFLIDPVLAVYIFGIFPIQTISQKYVLDWITNESLEVLASQNISYHQTNTTFDPCHSNKSDPDYQFQEYVQSKGAQFALYESIINGVPAFFVTIILGAGSDLFGRRFAILPPLVGTLLNVSIITCVISTKASIYWFFLGDVIIGCSGSFYSLLMGCLSYVADRTPPERRMIRITFLEMSMLISGVIGPIVLGVITAVVGYLIPLLIVVAMSAVNLIYVFIFLPIETKPNKELSAAESMTECPSSSDKSSFFSILSLLWIQVRSMVALFIKKSASTAEAVHWRRLKINLVIAAVFFTNLPTFDTSVSTLFMMNSPLCWSVTMIAVFYGVSYAASGVGAVILSLLFKRCRLPDYVIAILAGLACTATNVYKAFVQTTVMMFLSISLSMIGILILPSLRSLMSNQVNDDKQGSVFGAIACMEIICGIIGTTIFNSIYSATLFLSTGFVFLAMAAFYLTGSVIVSIYAVLIRQEARRGSSLSVPKNETPVKDAESD